MSRKDGSRNDSTTPSRLQRRDDVRRSYRYSCILAGGRWIAGLEVGVGFPLGPGFLVVRDDAGDNERKLSSSFWV